MPCDYESFDYARHKEMCVEIRNQLRAKFPKLMEGSAGWDRAYANRVKRWRAV